MSNFILFRLNFLLIPAKSSGLFCQTIKIINKSNYIFRLSPRRIIHSTLVLYVLLGNFVVGSVRYKKIR